MNNRIALIAIWVMLFGFYAQAIAQFSSGGSVDSSPSLAGRPDTPPTREQAENLIKQDDVYIFHGIINKRASQNQIDFYQRLVNKELIDAFQTINGLTATLTTKGREYLVEEKPDHYVVAASFAIPHSLTSMTQSQITQGGYTISGEVRLTQISPFGEVFGAKENDLQSYSMDIQFDLISNAWILAKNSPAISNWRQSQYGRKAVADRINAGYARTFYEGLDAVLQGTWISGNSTMMISGEEIVFTKKDKEEYFEFFYDANQLNDKATGKRVCGLEFRPKAGTIYVIRGPFSLRYYTKQFSKEDNELFKRIAGTGAWMYQGARITYSMVGDNSWEFVQEGPKDVIKGTLKLDEESGILTSQFKGSKTRMRIYGINEDQIVFQGVDDPNVILRLVRG
ncbi:MAG: hypothetical protein H6568_10925 [Lewinellaceae bacterium]|nr:hypothetical protein [Saprospiraceae bacterium]MCB9313269.1 hypothetical protein [Lewinellaceae bacterium]